MIDMVIKEFNNSMIEKAKWVAQEAHEGQKRKYTGEPYYTHVESVANRVAKIMDDPELIAAALLHDTVEDSDVTVDEIGEIFGLRVAEIVYDLTDHFTKENYPNLNRKERKRLEAKRLGGISEDAKMVKLCDLADNTSSIIEHDPGFARIYLKEKSMVLKAMGF